MLSALQSISTGFTVPEFWRLVLCDPGSLEGDPAVKAGITGIHPHGTGSRTGQAGVFPAARKAHLVASSKRKETL